MTVTQAFLVAFLLRNCAVSHCLVRMVAMTQTISIHLTVIFDLGRGRRIISHRGVRSFSRSESQHCYFLPWMWHSLGPVLVPYYTQLCMLSSPCWEETLWMVRLACHRRSPDQGIPLGHGWAVAWCMIYDTWGGHVFCMHFDLHDAYWK